MKILFRGFTFLIILSSFILAQEKAEKLPIRNSQNGAQAPQAVEGDVIFSDGTNQLMRITDEGTTGAIQFPSGVPANTDFKLYRNGANLFFNGTILGSGGVISIDSLDQLSDAKTDATSIFLGRDAGLSDDGTLNSNTAVGKRALKSNLSGSSNIAIGYNALLHNTNGISNSAAGTGALLYNTSGHSNSALGNRSLYLNSIGYFNVGIGYQVGYYNQEGDRNTFLGTEAGKGNGPHSKNGGIFIGYQSGYHEESDNKLYINNDSSSLPLIWGDFTDGNEQVKINGDFHVTGDITSDGNSLGAKELNDLFDAKTDLQSLFIGTNAGLNDDGGEIDNSTHFNTAIGFNALRENIDGEHNTALGTGALYSNTAGTRNAANGYETLYSNTTGYDNTANGYLALYSNTTGFNNTANGRFALSNNTTGYSNTANGGSALTHNTTGDYNTANGWAALSENTTGSYNTANGKGALYYNRTGDNNTAIGTGSGPSFFDQSNTTALGYQATTTADNQVRIGNSSVTSIGGYAAWSNLSDGRYKRNVRENVSGLDFILGLRPVTYNFDVNVIAEKLGEGIQIDENGIRTKAAPSTQVMEERESKSSKRQIGFIAQEVESLVNKLGIDFSGVEVPQNEKSMYSLRYAEFVVPLVKAVQEQQELIKKLTNRIEELEK